MAQSGDDKLAPRVMSLFRNYRQDWRNPSTHDHRLVFRDDERLLAMGKLEAPLAEIIVRLIRAFSESNDSAPEIRTEAELVGRLSGFIVAVAPEIHVTLEGQLGKDQRADLVVKRGEEVVVLEVRRGGPKLSLLENGLAQLRHHMINGGVASGILYIASSDSRSPVDEISVDDDDRTIRLIAPMDLIAMLRDALAGSSDAARGRPRD